MLFFNFDLFSLLTLNLFCQYFTFALPANEQGYSLYTNKQVDINVQFPQSNENIFGTVLYIQYTIDVYGKEISEHFQRHKNRTACIRLKEYPSGNIVAANRCQKNEYPKLLNVTPGQRVLELWLVDKNDGSILTEVKQVPINIYHRDSKFSLSQNIITTKKQSEVFNQHFQNLRNRSSTASYHEVIFNHVRQQVLSNEDVLNKVVLDVSGDAQIVNKLFHQPNLNNKWENIARAGMHGHMVPILAYLPVKNVVWWQILMNHTSDQDLLTNVLKSLKSVNSNGISNVGCTSNLNQLLVNLDNVEKKEDGLLKQKEYQHHTLLIFGRNWNELVLLHNVKRAIYLLKDLVNSKNVKQWNVTLYVGISPEFQEQHFNKLCTISSQYESQQLTLLNGGPLAGEIHRDPKPWMTDL